MIVFLGVCYDNQVYSKLDLNRLVNKKATLIYVRTVVNYYQIENHSRLAGWIFVLGFEAIALVLIYELQRGERSAGDDYSAPCPGKNACSNEQRCSDSWTTKLWQGQILSININKRRKPVLVRQLSTSLESRFYCIITDINVVRCMSVFHSMFDIFNGRNGAAEHFLVTT